MRKLFALFFLVVWLLLWLQYCGAAFAQGFTFPENPVVGQEVTGPGGVVYKWDGSKWAIVPASPGLPVINPVFTGTLTGTATGSILVPPSGTFTLPDTSTWTSAGLNLARPLNITPGAFSPAYRSAFVFSGDQASIGQGTSANLAVAGGATYDGTNWRAGTGLSAASILNVSPNVIEFFGATGLTGGATFTPPAALLSISPSAANFSVPLIFNRNVTYQMAGDWNLTRDVDGMQMISVLNGSAGPNAQAAFNLRNDTGQEVWFVQEGSGLVGNWNGFQKANSSGIISPGNFWLAADGGGIEYWVGHRNTIFDIYGLRLISDTSGTMRSQVYFDAPGATNVWANWLSGGNGNLNIGAGCYYDQYTWLATHHVAQITSWGGNEINFHVASGLTPGVGIPWVRNAYFAPNALYAWQRQDGGQYNLGVSGTIHSYAKPWDGANTVDAANVQLWVCNGCCAPVSTVSGYMILTELWYRGASAAYLMGGGGVSYRGQSWPAFQAPYTWGVQGGNDPTGCGPAAGQNSLCYSAPYYWLCNNMGADSVYGIMMVETRNTV